MLTFIKDARTMRRYITVLGLFLGPRIAAAQDGLSLGTVRTAAAQQAVRIVGDFLKNVPDVVFEASKSPSAPLGWWFLAYPEAKLLTGDKDAFQGVETKLTGTFAYFHVKSVGGAPAVDMDKTMWAAPLSLAAETDGTFRKTNVLAEAGVVPIFPGQYNWKAAFWLGGFLQGGYKFKTADSTGAAISGGAADQSNEPTNSALLRLKVDTRLDLPIGPSKSPSLHLITKGTYWYDLANSANYYHAELVIRLPLGGKESFDVTYEKGSGAPNFNKGDQFSTNIRVAF
jgi:hypothetical protein